MLAAGEALLVPWMKSLGNGQQAGAFPLREDKEGGEEEKPSRMSGTGASGEWGARGLEASPSDMGASLESPSSG